MEKTFSVKEKKKKEKKEKKKEKITTTKKTPATIELLAACRIVYDNNFGKSLRHAGVLQVYKHI